MQAVSRFKRWAGDCVVMTWGTSDILTLIENCRYFSGDEHVPFLSRYCDLQVFAQDRMGLGRREQVGLSKAAELLGLDVSGMEHHRALDDSRMTLEILRKIYDPGAIAPYIDLCDREFYRRITFKTTYICDLRSPLVEKTPPAFSLPPGAAGKARPPDPLEREEQELSGGFPLHMLRPPVCRKAHRSSRNMRD